MDTKIAYTARSGREFQIEQVRPYKDIPAFWTYTHEGYGPSYGSSYNWHATPEAAIERIEQTERIRIAEQVPTVLDRVAYEAACREAGVEAMTDGDCNSYGVRYGEYDVPEYAVDVVITMLLARRRLAGIEAERAAAPKAAKSEMEMATCPHCRQAYPRALGMSSARGTVCPDCYDECSD